MIFLMSNLPHSLPQLRFEVMHLAILCTYRRLYRFYLGEDGLHAAQLKRNRERVRIMERSVEEGKERRGKKRHRNIAWAMYAKFRRRFLRLRSEKGKTRTGRKKRRRRELGHRHNMDQVQQLPIYPQHNQWRLPLHQQHPR